MKDFLVTKLLERLYIFLNFATNLPFHHRMLQSALLKQLIQQAGFSACGMTRATHVSTQRSQELQQWLAEGCHGKMDYLARNVDKKLDPRLLVEGAKTIVSVAMNYYPGDWDETETHNTDFCDEMDQKERFHRKNALRLSRYAYGTDYHEVVKNKLRQVMQQAGLTEGVDGRVFVDTAPIDEKYWAEQCGLGWRGRNCQLIIPGMGSFFFLGELVLTHEVDRYDAPAKNHCGTCHRCLDTCPMQALRGDGTMDARKCLSYLTIECRDELPQEAKKKMGNCFYGCDRCAEVCPWNQRFARATEIEELKPREAICNMTPTDWQTLTVEQYRQIFTHSAVKRAKFEGLMRNIRACKEGNE